MNRMGWMTILICPTRQLEPGRKHTLKVTCELSGQPFEESWDFTTGR